MSSNKFSSSSLTRHGAAARRSRKARGRPQSSGGPAHCPPTHTGYDRPVSISNRFSIRTWCCHRSPKSYSYKKRSLMRKCRSPSLIACIVAAEPAKAWHGVVLLADAKAMEMEVRPVEADLQEDVKIGQGAF